MKFSKLLRLMLAGFLVTSALYQPAFGNPNSVYIAQFGVSNNVMIDQIGGNNGVGGVASAPPSDTNYATISGDINTVVLSQVGLNNLAQYSIYGSTNSYTSTVSGGNNVNKLRIGSMSLSKNENTITENITGSNNFTDQTVTADQVVSNVIIDGSYNDTITTLSSNKGNVFIEVQNMGYLNRVEVEQMDSAGVTGHSAKAVIDGTQNSVLIQQQGTNDSIVDVKISGYTNTVTVRSSSSTIVNPRVAPPR